MLTSIPSTLSSAVADWQDTTLKSKSQGGLAETCIIYYAPLASSISTPQLTPVGAKTLDIIPTAGDFPVQFGQEDPMEFGQNFIYIEQTETIYMTVQWTPAEFSNKFVPGFKYQAGTIMTKGFVSDLQKIRNAEYMEIFQSAGYDHYKFKLIGEPVIPGQFTGARYFYAWWARA